MTHVRKPLSNCEKALLKHIYARLLNGDRLPNGGVERQTTLDQWRKLAACDGLTESDLQMHLRSLVQRQYIHDCTEENEFHLLQLGIDEVS
jgi:hypothetical protein